MNNSFIFDTAREGFKLVLFTSTLNGDPYTHHIYISKEKVKEGEIVKIITSPETSSVFSVSQLKTWVFDLLKKVCKEDYRDLNFNIFDDPKLLESDLLSLTKDYREEYKAAKLKHLSVSNVKAHLHKDNKITYDFKEVALDNSLPKVKFVPIQPSLYTSDEDRDNIELNKLTVGDAKLPSFVLNTLKAFESGSHNCALFYGEASTGKSFAARILAKSLNIPVYSYNFAAGSDESFVQGKYTPKEDDAGFTFLQNSFIKAYSEGGLFVAEELNYAFANVTGPLNSALDFLKKITLANERQLEMHPNFRMVTCINPGYEGTQPLNRALLSRQELVVRFENLTPKEIATRLKDRYGYSNKEFAIAIGEFLEKLNSLLNTQGIDGYVSLREVESCLKLCNTTGCGIVTAIYDTILNKVLLNETSESCRNFIKVLDAPLKELSELYDNTTNEDIEFTPLKVSNIDNDEIEDVFNVVDGMVHGYWN